MRGAKKEEILQIHPIFLLRRSGHSKRNVKSTSLGRLLSTSLALSLHLS